ncbi:Ddi1p SCDLUD_001615 [Saccharomycodes ludwigii]|uniref:Ddi1p n=1 Tax=Saccharomycodes ludwigii TaxID=36035 RepID=UPI001E8BFD84|nr:hypothetical protein SCDLUD_001615 [Saccharomycodes ludwigii]KAH3901832.1 hypothetical protein SCDLUD_001615 [Saccharomycodes ludwigii]
MSITVSNEVNNITYGPIEVTEDMLLSDLIALLQYDAEFDPESENLVFKDEIIDINSKESQTLEKLGLVISPEEPNSNDTTLLLIRGKDLDPVEKLRISLKKNEKTPAILKEEILLDPYKFDEFLKFIQLTNKTGQPLASILRDNSKLEEFAYQRIIDEQMAHALEYTPEVFTPVTMLFINLEINGHPVKAFIDSGAQTTIISTKLAKETKLDRLIDKRFKGEARGVGKGEILGKIHSAMVKIESQFVSCAFTVLDTNMDLLLGLDMLRRHLANIDLGRNVLKIAGIETPFLGEADIPKTGLFAQNSNPNPLEQVKAPQFTKIQNPPQVKRPKIETSVLAADRNDSLASDKNVETAETTNTHSFPEETIKNLVALGFSRQQVIDALKATNGNAEYAASLLFQ